LLVTALYDAEIGHYGTEVTQHRLRRVFRLPDVSLEWDSVRHNLAADGRLYVEIQLKPSTAGQASDCEERLRNSLCRVGRKTSLSIQLKPMRPYKCDMTTEELQIDDVVDDDVSSTTCDVTDEPVAGPSWECTATSAASASAASAAAENDLSHEPA